MLSTHESKDPIDQKKKRKTSYCGRDRLITTSLSTSSSSISSGGMTCSADQCTMPSASSSLTSSALQSFTIEEKKEENSFSSISKDEIKHHYLLSFLPSDIVEAMQEAAKKSFLPAFLSSLTEEFLTDYLKKRDYSTSQIYYINQVIRSLTIISLGASLTRTLTSSGINLVSKKCVSEKYSGYVSSAAFLAYDFYLDPANFLKTGCTFAANMGSSLIASSAAKYCYQTGCGLVQNSFFALKKTAALFHTKEQSAQSLISIHIK